MNYLLSRLQMGGKPVFITGHGRSGTTWIGNTFSQAQGVLYCNEPCNPDMVKGADFSAWFRYIRSDENDPYFERCLDTAFKGLMSYRSDWLKQRAYRRLLPGYRVVVKEVASFMSLEWVCKRYDPDVLVVFRHPCAVALSEKNKKTPIESPIMEMIKQAALVDDHLKPYEEVFEKAKTPFEIYGAVWAARNRVIVDLMPHYPEWKILFYEDLCRNPLDCFQELFDRFNLDWSDKVEKFIKQTTTEHEPGTYSISRVSEQQLNKWKSVLTKSEIDQIRSFVEPFNLPFYNQDSDWV